MNELKDDDIVSTAVTEDVTNTQEQEEQEEQEEPKEDVIPSIGFKEYKALKKARYGEIAKKFRTAYLLRKNKTGQIVEIRAVSSYQACKIIGWKPQQVTLLKVTEYPEEKDTTEDKIDKIDKIEQTEQVEPSPINV